MKQKQNTARGHTPHTLEIHLKICSIYEQTRYLMMVVVYNENNETKARTIKRGLYSIHLNYIYCFNTISSFCLYC